MLYLLQGGRDRPCGDCSARLFIQNYFETLTNSLRLVDCEKEKASRSFQKPPKQVLSMKILVVEDTQMYREIFVRVCHEHGDHDIRSAGTLAEADVVRETFVPDMVLSDNSLPDGKGPSRFPAIRKQNPAVAICLMTGKTEPENHGADYFFQKTNVMLYYLHRILSEAQNKKK